MQPSRLDPIISRPQPPAQAVAPDLTALDDDQLISQRSALRTRLGQLPWNAGQRTALEELYEAFTDEFDRRARAAWQQAAPRQQSTGPAAPPLTPQPRQGVTVENPAAAGKDLLEFERTYFERLRLAAQVIIEAAPDLQLVTDPLEAELQIFKERVEFLLLVPAEYAVDAIPWRKLLNGEQPPGA